MSPKTIRKIAAKELNLFFSSPIAYLFLGVFIAITLFIFFWGESFFSRNIADVRPMFEWMPILLILLCSALTMRMWSEERRSGTLEHVMTLPVSTWSFVLGKFAACKTLLAIALLLTLPLPITLSFMADIDWGPIVSGYVATLFLGSAYLAIGLYVSARCDNQIVSLILTVLICSIFYLLGTDLITGFFGHTGAELLRNISTGGRFQSITRGLLDVRDFYYYISIVAAFLLLNRHTLEKVRWANNPNNHNHRRWTLFTAAAIANVLIANIWLSSLGFLRVDTTQGHIYSISDATRGYLKQLQEPLLIRGYFSAKSHPKLAPLVPQLIDLIKEYEQQGFGNIRVEIIDPAKNEAAEEEAGQKYGIRPNPFRVDDKYESAVVNSYFNVLIKYGDEYKVLGFQDFIEVHANASSDFEVRLRNPEYDLTNAIKQVLYAYQSGGNLFDSITTPLAFKAYISPDDKLPPTLAKFLPTVKQTLEKLQQKSAGKLSVEYFDPEANGGALASEIAEDYGFQPMAASFFDDNTFYFHMLLANKEIGVQIPIPEAMDAESLERDLDAALKRFATGFTKTIGIVAPENNPYAAQMGQQPKGSFNNVQQMLNKNMTAKTVKLDKGVVPADIDLLMVLAPEDITDKGLFAIDQFLMQGGTVILATAPMKANLSQQNLFSTKVHSGLEDWLQHNGIELGKNYVMDAQNTAFPMPVMRQVGMFQVQEMKLMNYPFFVEIRKPGLNKNHLITSGLQQLTLPWAVTVNANAEKNSQRHIDTLLTSSQTSWLNSDDNISPASDKLLGDPFAPGTIIGEQNLALAISGRFDSYFADKASPLLASKEPEATVEKSPAKNGEKTDPAPDVISTVLQRSPESARLIVVGSNSFAEDRVTGIMSSINGNNYVAPLEFLTNAAEWSLEDSGLLSIRSRAHFNRTLPSMSDSDKQFWEWLNYVLALAALTLVYIIRKLINKQKVARYIAMLKNGATA